VLIYDDIYLLLKETKRHPIMSATQERALAQKIEQSRVDLWHHALSYVPLTQAILDWVKPKFLAACEHSKMDLRVRGFSACKSAARDYRDRDIKRNKDTFQKTTLVLAKHFAKIDGSLEIVTAVQTEAKKRKPFGATTPRKGSCVFGTYLDQFDEKLRIHRAYKEKFWLANIRLVISMTKKYDHGRLPFADLLQEGLLGLMTAIERFDVSRGLRFSTYATHWIRHALNRYTANYGRTVRWPAHAVADFYKLKKIHEKLIKQRATVTVDSLAKESGFKPSKIQRMLGLFLGQHISMDQQLSGLDQPTTLADRIPEENLVIDEEDPRLDPGFLKLIENMDVYLSNIECDILTRRFGLDGKEPMTLRQLGQRHGLSRERIRQLQVQSLETLRQRL